MERLLPQIKEIIDRSRREEEALLVDSKTAAERIIEYLKEEGVGRLVLLKVA